MMEQTDSVENATEAAQDSTLLSALRRVLMAGIGAVALTREEIEDFVNKLVERGEIADGDARKVVNDVLDWSKKNVQGSARRAEEEVDKRVEYVMSRLNMPTRSEIETLSAKIAELSQKVDELKDVSTHQ